MAGAVDADEEAGAASEVKDRAAEKVKKRGRHWYHRDTLS